MSTRHDKHVPGEDCWCLHPVLDPVGVEVDCDAFPREDTNTAPVETGTEDLMMSEEEADEAERMAVEETNVLLAEFSNDDRLDTKLSQFDAQSGEAVSYIIGWLRNHADDLITMARGRNVEGHYRYGESVMYEYSEQTLMAEAAQELADAIVYTARRLHLETLASYISPGKEIKGEDDPYPSPIDGWASEKRTEACRSRVGEYDCDLDQDHLGYHRTTHGSFQWTD